MKEKDGLKDCRIVTYKNGEHEVKYCMYKDLRYTLDLLKRHQYIVENVQRLGDDGEYSISIVIDRKEQNTFIETDEVYKWVAKRVVNGEVVMKADMSAYGRVMAKDMLRQIIYTDGLEVEPNFYINPILCELEVEEKLKELEMTETIDEVIDEFIEESETEESKIEEPEEPQEKDFSILFNKIYKSLGQMSFLDIKKTYFDSNNNATIDFVARFPVKARKDSFVRNMLDDSDLLHYLELENSKNDNFSVTYLRYCGTEFL